jgi:hypothetical protein
LRVGNDRKGRKRPRRRKTINGPGFHAPPRV